jgi:hypothetical protein
MIMRHVQTASTLGYAVRSTVIAAWLNGAKIARSKWRTSARAQACALFALVRLHSAKDVIQHLHCLHKMWPFVEHDAFGPFAHGRICDFSA